MNSLKSELDSINSQLELLTYRKKQLDTIMGEYSDVVNRVKNLINSMEDVMIEPVNLLMEIEGLIHGQEFEVVEPEPTPEPTTEPPLLAFLQSQPLETIQDIHPSDDKPIHEYIIDNKAVCHLSKPDTESNIAITDAGNVTKPELTQINSRAWRRENTLLIGFSNKRLLNVWSNWFKSSWSGQIHISENNDKLEGFEHCLGVMWYGSMPEVKRWERLTNLDYAFRPDEQQGIGIVKAV